MKSNKISVAAYSKINLTRYHSFHEVLMNKLCSIPSPMGFRDAKDKSTTVFDEETRVFFYVKGLPKEIKFTGIYRKIFDDSVNNKATYDNILLYEFPSHIKGIDFRNIFNELIPNISEIFSSYNTVVKITDFQLAYCGGYIPSEDGSTAFDENGYQIKNNSRYNELAKNTEIDIDGRNNIFTLHLAQFWDNELCQKALGYGPDEVIKRLQGKVPKVEKLMDGVYLILNDDPSITYDQFVEMNNTYKPILGLI